MPRKEKKNPKPHAKAGYEGISKKQIMTKHRWSAWNLCLHEIQRREMKLVIEALKEKGIELDIRTEEQSRFKKLRREQGWNSTTYYYNDGSIQGLEVITLNYNQQTAFKKLVYTPTDRPIQF